MAAAELAAFRATAQTERQRSQAAEEAALGRVRALEEELKKREALHAAELSRLHETLDSQLKERERAWAQFSDGLRERMANLAAAREQHARDVEEASGLRRQLHGVRTQLDAAKDAHAELERRLSASEEAVALAASELQKTRDEAATLRTRGAELARELHASASHCAQLQTETRAQATKLTEADSLRSRLEDELRAQALQLRDLRAEREQLLGKTAELATLQSAHSELEARANAQAAELDARHTRIVELTRASRELDALRALHSELELRAQSLKSELAQAEARAAELKSVQAALTELDLEYTRVKQERSKLLGQLEQAQAREQAFEYVQQEAGQLREAMVQLETTCSEQRAALEAAEQTVRAAREREAEAQKLMASAQKLESEARERIRVAEADVEAARRERDQVRSATEARLNGLSELESQLTEARTELSEHAQTRWAMLDIEKQRNAKLKAELAEAREALAALSGGRAERPRSSDDSTSDWEPATEERELDAMELLPVTDPPSGPDSAALQAIQTLQPAANTAARPRESTAYSFTELAEEQIIVPSRIPSAAKAPSGGRGNR